MWVIVRGGLGNQMFQVAHATALSNRLGLRAKFVNWTKSARVPREWQLSCFGIEPDPVSYSTRAWLLAKLKTTGLLFKAGLTWDIGVMLESGRVSSNRVPNLVSGYWQSPAYFDGYEEIVKEMFKFPGSEGEKRCKSDVSTTSRVAIHVRRGDYASDSVARNMHLVCDARWYERAWHRIRSDISSAEAIVFSDDQDWARNNLRLRGAVQFMEYDCESPAWLDMARMSECDHFIISNSSYSWWAAYLGGTEDKLVIAPKNWFINTASKDLNICPKEWLLL